MTGNETLTSVGTMTSIVEQIQIGLPEGWREHLPEQLLLTDASKMDFVLRLAEWNVEECNGGPFGAAVFCRNSNELVSIGLNRVVASSCSLAHAEALAIALAQQQQGTHDLSGAGSFELVTSGQPCAQCFGMLWWSGITRLVIGARATDVEELTAFSEGPLPNQWRQQLASRRPLPSVEVVTDICRERARQLLKDYTMNGGSNYSPGG